MYSETYQLDLISYWFDSPESKKFQNTSEIAEKVWGRNAVSVARNAVSVATR